jgi:protein O-mannosyl-transferase
MTDRTLSSLLLLENSAPLRRWGLALVIAAAVLAAYCNSFPGGYFFDDDDAILQNASIRDLHNWRDVLWPPVAAGIGGRPVANLTYALNYALHGYDITGYHAVNLATHIGTALLLFGLVRRTLLRPVLREKFGSAAEGVAAIVALLWALHPLQANVTNYASQRTEGLMATFYVLTLYAFLRSVEERSRAWAVVSLIACALGMGTKEGMVTAPVMVLLYDRTFVSGAFRQALERHWRIYAGLAATWLLLAGLMMTSKLSERGVGFGLGQTAYAYGLTEFRSVARYLELVLWPHSLLFDYGPDYVQQLSAIWPSFALLLTAIGATLFALWRRPLAGFAAAWFLVVLSPSSSVVPVVQQPCAENRPYLALAGVVALLAAGAYRAVGRTAVIGLGIASVALGFATAARNPVFGSELAVWWDTVAKHPENARAENNLGNALLKRGRTAEAARYFDAALRFSPDYPDAHNNRGVVFLRLHQVADAIPEFRKAIEIKPKYSDAHYNLGEAYLQLGQPAEAIKSLETALQLNPTNPKAHNNLGIALLDTGRIDGAIREERRALELDPTMPEAHYNLGNSFAKAGHGPEAVAEFEAALRLDPAFARAHNNAGVALLQMGRPQDAAVHFEAALRIDPKYPEAQRNLTLVHSRTSVQ